MTSSAFVGAPKIESYVLLFVQKYRNVIFSYLKRCTLILLLILFIKLSLLSKSIIFVIESQWRRRIKKWLPIIFRMIRPEDSPSPHPWSSVSGMKLFSFLFKLCIYLQINLIEWTFRYFIVEQEFNFHCAYYDFKY